MPTYLYFIIPAVFLLGIIGMIIMNRRAAGATGLAQPAMESFAQEQIPTINPADYDFVHASLRGYEAMRDIILAYNEDDLFFIPVASNPLSRKLKQVETDERYFSIKSTYASCEYVPVTAISTIEINDTKAAVTLTVNATPVEFTLPRHDLFGTPQDTAAKNALGFFARLKNTVEEDQNH